MPPALRDPVVLLSPDDRPSARCGEVSVATLGELNALGFDLADAEQLRKYCGIANHLCAGGGYRLIEDADAYCTRYADRLAAEGPEPPWQGGVPHLGDFGRFDIALISAPRVEDGYVVAFVEDAVLGIPYVARFPLAGVDGEDIAYDPLPLEPGPATERDHV